MPPTRILILRFSSIGDIVLTTPVLRQLANQLDGEVEIHYLTKKPYAPLLAHNPHVHTIHTFEKDLTEVFDVLMELGFDYIVDLHNNVRSSIAKRKVKSLEFTLNKRNRDKWLLVNFGIDKLKGQHIVQRYLETVKAFNLKDDGEGLDLFLPDNLDVRFPDGFDSPYAVLAVGAAHDGKRMTSEQLIEIVNGLNKPVVLLGGSEDQQAAEAVNSAATNNTWNACGETSLLESARIIQKAVVAIAGDTGMMHVAAALQTPVISVWGCTSPAIGMSPWRPHPDSVIVEPEGRSKRPCSKLGNRCKYKGKAKCIATIGPDRIFQAANTISA